MEKFHGQNPNFNLPERQQLILVFCPVFLGLIWIYQLCHTKFWDHMRAPSRLYTGTLLINISRWHEIEPTHYTGR